MSKRTPINNQPYLQPVDVFISGDKAKKPRKPRTRRVRSYPLCWDGFDLVPRSDIDVAARLTHRYRNSEGDS